MECKQKSIDELTHNLGMILFNFSKSCENPEHILKIKIKDGFIEDTSIIYEDIKEVSKTEEENKDLRKQLQEIHQANVRLNNKVLEQDNMIKELQKKEHELKVLKFQDNFNRRVVESITNENIKLKSLVKHTDTQYNELITKQDAEIEQLKEDNKFLNREVGFWKESFNSCVNLKISAEDTCSNLSIKLNKLEEEKKSYNKGLDELHQVLEEEIKAYDINMSKMLKKYEVLEKELSIYKGPQSFTSQIIKSINDKLDKFKDYNIQAVDIEMKIGE